MAQPSSSHHRDERDREHRHRSERSSHHHHRTISSTTLLLVLSLILAVLAVMLSLPSQGGVLGGSSSADPTTGGLLSYLSPKRTQALISREHAVAQREAEVARREAELLAGAPGGILPPSPSPSVIACPPCPIITEPQTIIKEVVKEEALTPPGWWKEAGMRTDDLLDRELKMAEREREISKREESVNRREHDASRRESWIMEQLIVLGNDGGAQTVEEEYIYEQAPPPKRKSNKALPPVVNEISYETEIRPVTPNFSPDPVQAPPPANTRFAAFPTPMVVSSSSTTSSPRTTAVEVVVEDEFDDMANTVRAPRPTRRHPVGWFEGW